MVFVTNIVVFVTNTVVFGTNRVVIGSKNSDILGTKKLFWKIHWYVGVNTALIGETQWLLWEIQW